MALAATLVAVALTEGALGAEAAKPRQAAKPDEGVALLQKLRSFDAVYMAALTYRGTDSQPASVAVSRRASSASLVPTPVQWSLSRAGDVVAVAQQVKPVLKYVAPEPGKEHKPRGDLGPGEVTYEADKMVVLVRNKTVTLYDHDRAAQLLTDTYYAVLPDNTVQEEGATGILSFTKPDSRELCLPVEQAMWVAGRGYSPFLRKVLDVKTLAGGRLALKADGFVEPGDRGYWELEVEPAASYMVRAARYFSEGATSPFLDIANSGLGVEENCHYPKQGTFKLSLAGLGQAHEVSFESARLKTDDALLAAARETFGESYPPNCVVSDYRTEPATSFTTDEQGRIRGRNRPEEPAETVPLAGGAHRLPLFVVGVLVLVALMFLLGRDRSVRRGASDAKVP